MAKNHNIENELNKLIIDAIIQQLPSIILPRHTTYNNVRRAIRDFMRSHPEIFWFSHQYIFDETSSKLHLKYNFTVQKREFYTKQIDNAVRYLFQPEHLANLSDIEKVAYVYKWIAQNTTYNEYSSFNQSIYSVLINRNSVCTGYAKTAQYLLGLIGVESQLIFGKFNLDASLNGRHAWNIVKIDNEWYHVDFSFADPSLKYLLNSDELPIEYDGLLWNFFCKPTEYIIKNRSIENVEVYPLCSKNINRLFKVTLPRIQNNLVVCKSASGSTSIVYLNPSDKDSVIKVARYNSELIDNEALMLQRLKNCDHVVKLKARSVGVLVLEQLTPWGELLNSHYYKLNGKQLIDILIQLAKGLIECKINGITYSDIHYNNVLVSNDGTYKWCDFGFAFPSTSDCSLPPQIFGRDDIAFGSRWFMAPETYSGKLFTESSAIYSLAMLAYFVMNDMRPPFWSVDISKQEALRKIHSSSTIPVPVNASKYGMLPHFICDILNADVPQRIQTFKAFITLLRKVDVAYPTRHKTNPKVVNNAKIDSDIFASTASRPDIIGGSASYEIDSFAKTCAFGDDNTETYSPSRVKTEHYNNPVAKLDAAVEQKTQEINACIYAPAEVRLKQSFIIRVYMYLPNEQEEVDSKIRHIDPGAVKKEYQPLEMPIKAGDKITVQLSLPNGVECKKTTKSVISPIVRLWQNYSTATLKTSMDALAF